MSQRLWAALRTTARRLNPLQELASAPYNEQVLYREVGFQAALEAGATSFLPVYLVRLGASNWLVGLFQSLPALMTSLASLPMGVFVQRRRNLVATANGARLIFRVGLSLFALLPLLPPQVAAYVLVLAYSALFIPAAAGSIAFTTILGQVTTPERRPRMLSTRLAIAGLCAAGVGLGAGQWLGSIRYPLNYQVLFVAALVFGLASIYMLSRLKLPARADVGERPRSTSWRDMWHLITGHCTFRNYCLAAFLFRLNIGMPQALYSIYRVRILGASEAWLGVLFTVERLLGVLVYFSLARLLARRGLRRWLWLSCVAVAFYPFTMALARTPQMLLIPSVLSGIFGSAMNIFVANTLFQVSPERDRPPFIAVDSILASLTSFAGPLLGTALAAWVGIVPALLIIAGLRVLGGLSFWGLRAGVER